MTEAVIPKAQKPRGKFGPSKSIGRIGKYIALRAATIGIAVIVGVFLTIVIGNWGGHLDEIKKARIQESVNMQLMEDEYLRLLPLEERREMAEAMEEDEKRRQGLDRPFWVRTPGYLIGALTLRLGWAADMTSPSGSRLVRLILLERIPATLVLFGSTSLLLFFTSLFAALFLSRRYGSKLDKLIIALAPTSAAPGWFYGIFLILFFAIAIPILPFGGMVEAPPPPTMWGYALSLLQHMVLPVLAMVIGSIFASIYSSRTFFLIYSSEDYVDMAKAKGLSSRAIERRYVLRPTLPPILWGFMMMLITLWMGSIIMERVFNWPGLGGLIFEAIGRGETPVVIGSVIIYAYLLAVSLFMMDIVFALVDPRVKVGSQRRA